MLKRKKSGKKTPCFTCKCNGLGPVWTLDGKKYGLGRDYEKLDNKNL
jgi:hypothetical protein